MIDLTMTYTVTGTDTLDGMPEVLESGFEFEARPHTFEELLQAMAAFPIPSDRYGVPRWLSAEPTYNEVTGLETQYTLHPCRDERSERAWARAWALLQAAA